MADPDPQDLVPDFTPEQAVRVAVECFDFGGEATPLPSDRDQNFRIDAPGGATAVLKIANAGERPEILDLRNEALERLARAGLPYRFPRPLPTRTGALVDRVHVDTEGDAPPARVTAPGAATGRREYHVRLVAWVPGTPLAEIRPHAPSLLSEVGRMLGEVDRALEGWSPPAARRELAWELGRGRVVVDERVDGLSGPDEQSLVERVVADFDHRGVPLLDSLPRGVIHGDANDWNVLVTPATAPGEEARVAGLLDFGDMVTSWRVAEVAIAAAYAMLGKRDPLAAAGHLVAGYHAVRPLSEAELAALYPLVRLRLALSVVMSAHQRRLRPDNAYLAVSEPDAWALLRRLDEVPPVLAACRLRDACGLDPHARSAAVTAWLTEHEARAAPVLDPDPREVATVRLDFGQESPFLLQRAIRDAGGRGAGRHGGAADGDAGVGDGDAGAADAPSTRRSRAARTTTPTDADLWSRLIDRAMEDAGADVGVGAYGEVRPWYEGEAYEVETDEGAEQRTVHLGLDLFAPAGTPVRAPFGGVVEAAVVRDRALDYGGTVVLRHDVERSGEPLAFWTLYGHLSPASLDGLAPGDRIEAGRRFAELGSPSENGGWAPHLHLQLLVDPLGDPSAAPGVARPSLRRLWESLSPDPAPLCRVPGGGPPPLRATREELLERRRRLVAPNLSVSYRSSLHIVRGRGPYLFDADGQRHLDCVNNVAHVGHEHPRVVRALARQAAVLNTNTRYLHERLTEYAERLAETLPDPLSVCFFVSSGSEANELALRLARTHTGRRDVVVLDGAYHGSTGQLVAMSPYKTGGGGGFDPPDWVHAAPLPDLYRGRYRTGSGTPGGHLDSPGATGPTEDHGTDPTEDPGTGPTENPGTADAAVARYLDDLEAALRGAGRGARETEEGRRGSSQESPDPEAATGSPVAAFFAEALPSCAGQIVLPDGYLEGAYARARGAGAICVADEVQTGFGRVGSHRWGFETQGVVPDIVTLGKPIGNGHPLAAVVTTPEVAASFDTGMEFFSTFGGNPVSCAVGLAVLDILRDEGLQEHARRVGARLKRGLEKLADRHPLIGEVRGLGLFLGVELVLDRGTREPAPAHAAHLVERMRAHRILLSTDGPDHNVIKIKPPLPFGTADADRLLDTLDRVLGEDALRLDPGGTSSAPQR